MDLDFTEHAREKFEDPRLTLEMVEHIVSVGRRLPSPSGNTIFGGLLPDGRPMRVILALEYFRRSS